MDSSLEPMTEGSLLPSPQSEKLLSAFGATLGIGVMLWVSTSIVGIEGAAWVVASMGATTVLLFAVPHGALSQPWSVVGGHLISAVVGVSCANWIADPLLAAPLAVGISVGAMYYTRCIHPPGGASALAAVVGGPAIHALGYGYLIAPVLINLAVLLIVAILFNYPFPWRRYPMRLAGRNAPLDDAVHRGLLAALKEESTFIDVTEEDLERICRAAMARVRGGPGS